MRNSFRTELGRTINSSLTRFIAIVLIVFLGCGFYSGLSATGQDMRIALDRWAHGSSLFDIQLVSTLGFDKDQVDTIKKVEGVDRVEGVKSVDVMASINNERYAMRIQDFDVESAINSEWDSKHTRVVSDNDNYLNRIVLEKGKFPTKADECLVSSNRIAGEPVEIGDKVSVLRGVESLDNVLDEKTFTVVGLVSSPLYMSNVQLGFTLLGSGSLTQFMYVMPEAFNKNVEYTQIFLTCNNTDSMSFASDEYKTEVDFVKANIEEEIDGLKKSRIANIKGRAQEEIDEGRKRLDASQNLVDSSLNSSQTSLQSALDHADQAQRRLEDSKREYEQGKADLAEAKEASALSLRQSQADIDKSQKELDLAKSGLKYTGEEAQKKKSDLQNQIIETSHKKDECTRKLTDVKIALRKHDSLQREQELVNRRKSDLENEKKRYYELLDLRQKSLDRQYEVHLISEDTYNRRKELIESDRQAQEKRYEERQQSIDESQKAIDEAIGSLEDRQTLQNQKQQLEQTIEELDSQKQELSAELKEVDNEIRRINEVERSQRRIDAAQRNLDLKKENAKRHFAFSEARLERIKNKINNNNLYLTSTSPRKTFTGSSASNIDARLMDAASQLERAQREIDDIEDCDIYLLDRTKNVGCVLYHADSTRMDNIASVFPLIFFLVAALVSLTTMTRMVDDERIEIGTHKALGFSTSYIAGKYLVYAALAAGIGAILGILVLSQILPSIIMKAYAIAYSVPISSKWMPLNYIGVLKALAFGVGTTLLATWAAVKTSLRETPASLMLPRAPKPGKRILAERTFLWKHISFSWKVTLRNLFRYKKRLIMTIVGIGGCSALILTGFGLHDSIGDIINLQYASQDAISSYNCKVLFDEQDENRDFDRCYNILSKQGEASRYMAVVDKNMVLSNPDTNATCALEVIVPSDTDTFSDFVDMHTRQKRQSINFTSNSVVISEKASRMLGVGVGDSIEVYNQDALGEKKEPAYKLKITDICENYVMHYLYVGKDAWENGVSQSYEANCILSKVNTDWFVKAKLSEELEEVTGVATVSYNTDIIDSYTNSLASVNMVVALLVVAAAALAFIVLYNITNMNIIERTREIASLKVLGFTQREVAAYVYREIILLVGMGVLAGLLFGKFMLGFVVDSAETDIVMFGRYIHISSYVLACVITFIFALLIMLFMKRKLRRIDMVESLKSVD